MLIAKSSKRKTARSALALAFFAGSLLCALLAVMYGRDADALRVTMKRVIFEGPTRTEVITIINNSAEEQAYRLGWRQLQMTEDKSLVALKKGETMPGFEYIDQMVRYAPRRIVLPPGASQQVRLMLRRVKDLPEGEYRGHFWIQPEAPTAKFNPDATAIGDGKSAVQIKMLTGISLPVIVRQGDMTVSAKIDDLKIASDRQGNPAVKYTIYREGNRSLYGDIDIVCAQPAGTETVLRQIRGVAVYTEVQKRFMSHVLSAMPEGGCRAITLRYRSEREDNYYKGDVIAEATVAM